MQHAVALQHQIDLAAIAVAVEPQHGRVARVHDRLANLRHDVVLEQRAAHRSRLESLRRAPPPEPGGEARVVEIKLGGFHRARERVIGIGLQQEHDVGLLEDAEPRLGLATRDIDVTRERFDVQRLTSLRGSRRHEPREGHHVGGLV